MFQLLRMILMCLAIMSPAFASDSSDIPLEKRMIFVRNWDFGDDMKAYLMALGYAPEKNCVQEVRVPHASGRLIYALAIFGSPCQMRVLENPVAILPTASQSGLLILDSTFDYVMQPNGKFVFKVGRFRPMDLKLDELCHLPGEIESRCDIVVRNGAIESIVPTPFNTLPETSYQQFVCGFCQNKGSDRLYYYPKFRDGALYEWSRGYETKGKCMEARDLDICKTF